MRKQDKLARSRIIRKSGKRDYCEEEFSELKRKWEVAITNDELLEYKLAPGYGKNRGGLCAISHDQIKTIEPWQEPTDYKRSERTD